MKQIASSLAVERPACTAGRVRDVTAAKAAVQKGGELRIAWIPACAGASLDCCLRRN